MLTVISVIIMGIIQLLAIPLARLRQPRVIAEVIGGVILGPTVMGRIPSQYGSYCTTHARAPNVLTLDQ